MIDWMKKMMLAGLGGAAMTKEKVEDMLKEFVDKGAISLDEAKKIAGKIGDRSKEEFEALGGQMSEFSKDMLGKMNIAKTADLTAIKGRMTKLENRIKALEDMHSKKK